MKVKLLKGAVLLGFADVDMKMDRLVGVDRLPSGVRAVPKRSILGLAAGDPNRISTERTLTRLAVNGVHVALK